MRHSACRHALLDGALDPDVAEHLEQCERCLAFSRDLAQVSEYAAQMAPPAAPTGLADRVIAHVHQTGLTGEAGDGVEHDTVELDELAEQRQRRASNPLLTGTGRNPLLAVTAVAAVMLLLVGVLALLPANRSDRSEVAEGEIDPLLAAAQGTLDSGSARVELTGRARVRATIPLDQIPRPEMEFAPQLPEPPPFQPPPPPDLSDLPPEARQQVEEGYAQATAEMEAAYEQFQTESERQYQQLRDDAAELFEQVSIPHEFSFEASLSGAGEVAFPDRLQMTGAIDITDAQPALPADLSDHFAVVVAGGETYSQTPDGRWLVVPGASGPLGPMVIDADGVANLLGGAQEGVEDLGEEILHNETVRHYRFGVDDDVFSAPGVEIDAESEVWVGDDDVVRRLRTSAVSRETDESGMTVEVDTVLTLDLSEFGVDVDVQAPEATGEADSPFGAAAVLFPHDDAFATSFHFGIGGGLPPPPSIEMPSFEDLVPEFELEPVPMPDFEFAPPPPVGAYDNAPPGYEPPDYEPPDYEEPPPPDSPPPPE